MSKYIFVTGGVTSSLGKGIISASLAKLLQARGYSVTIQKLDPYINVDPGTLNPYEHGECFVTDDGAETDLDLGHYERFLNVPTSQANNVTTGKIYQSVIKKERSGAYLGKTVQIIPHITDEIKSRIKVLGKDGLFDIIITEIGGTVGDIESLPYLESIRQMKRELGEHDCMVLHLTLIPYLRAAKELKTKPTQHSVKEMLSLGLQPDIIVCRTEHPINKEIREKLALFCNVKTQAVVEALDADTIYDVPLLMMKEKLDEQVLDRLKLSKNIEPDLRDWKEFLGRLKNPTRSVKIGLVGKYNKLQDAYKSIYESFIHAGAEYESQVDVVSIHSEDLENPSQVEKILAGLHGVLIAPGFGERGIEGKLNAIKFIREQNIPFLGICLGMQCAAVEFARNVLSIKSAVSGEVDPDGEHRIIDLMEDQKQITDKGGTMRLGSYDCAIKPGTLAAEIYKKEVIQERHRHRYEFNNGYLDQFVDAGIIASGINTEHNLVEIIEYKKHPFFIGVQFHPELKSTVENPHPLFTAFVKAAADYKYMEPADKARNYSKAGANK
ncbi:UNVERIFIED_CONTAM: hypothetical protein GTU68_056099 [Idotea baltica]|nr:hypothetical protein [Idotea baltica]